MSCRGLCIYSPILVLELTYMENSNTKAQDSKIARARAYIDIMYFLFFIIGICFNLIFNLKIFKGSIATPVGFIILVLATILIFWTQKTLRVVWKQDINKKNFSIGPYGYTRNPVQLGIFLLIVSFGLITNSFFIPLFAIVAFIIGTFMFLNKEEKALVEKYGNSYLEYKKLVKF